MTTDTTHADRDAEQLRGAMVDEVIVSEWPGLGPPREIEAALRTVPRHLFAPEVSLEAAYADDSTVTKRNERGGSMSSVSAPWLQSRIRTPGRCALLVLRHPRTGPSTAARRPDADRLPHRPGTTEADH